MPDSLFSYERFALIVWDVQYGITSRTVDLQSSLKNIRLLIQVTRQRKMPVVYSQTTGLPFEYQSAYQKFWVAKRGMDPRVVRMPEGSREREILPEVAPEKEDIVLKKYTHSLFVGTPLESLLRSKNIEVVIICGYSTEVGIEGTARHAGSLGFIPVVVEDAIGSSDMTLHEASLQVMRKMFEVDTTSSVIQKIQ